MGRLSMAKKSWKATTSIQIKDLHKAAKLGDFNVVRLICSANPLAVESRDYISRTPLHTAAWNGQSEVVDCLCKNKADVGAVAMSDMGAIHFAAQRGSLDVIKILVAAGACVNSTNRLGMTALHYAAEGSNTELVTYLLMNGANTDVKDWAGKTAADHARREEIRKLILGYASGNEDNAAFHGDKDGQEGSDEDMKRKKEDVIEENQEGAKKTKVERGVSFVKILTKDE